MANHGEFYAVGLALLFAVAAGLVGSFALMKTDAFGQRRYLARGAPRAGSGLSFGF